MSFDFLIERSEKPIYRGKLDNYNASFYDKNPVCGDEVKVYILIEDDKIKNARFEGKGCIISMASSDLLIESILNKNVDYVLSLNESFVRELVKIPLGINRIKCALLPLRVIQKAVVEYKKGNLKES